MVFGLGRRRRRRAWEDAADAVARHAHDLYEDGRRHAADAYEHAADALDHGRHEVADLVAHGRRRAEAGYKAGRRSTEAGRRQAEAGLRTGRRKAETGRRRAEAAYDEGRRRAGAAVDALAGRRTTRPAPIVVAAAVGVLAGAALAIGAMRMTRRRPITAPLPPADKVEELLAAHADEAATEAD